MASHGIHNRPPRRRFTDALTPETPPLLPMVTYGLVALLIVAVWAVVVTLILSH